MFIDVTWLEKPKIFLSSTMDKNTYVIRKGIRDKLVGRGYEVVAFETDYFPYANDQSSKIVQETVNAVATANVFVMIIDENSGSMCGKESVVQKEYNRAKELNITILSFIQKDLWEKFQSGEIDANGLIKTKEYFDFIKEVAEYKVSDYETADDCFEHIEKQLLNFLGGALKFSTKANWLWNENMTRAVEKNAKEVWIITPDFVWDFDDQEFHGIVVNNVVNRGCQYKYIYYDSPENEYKIQEMLRFYRMTYKERGDDPKKLDVQVQCLPVKPNRFFWPSEQILFDPFTTRERAIMVDVMNVRDKTRKFNIEFGLGKRVMFRKQFANYWNQNIGKAGLKIDIL